jgi:hypothetical protein
MLKSYIIICFFSRFYYINGKKFEGRSLARPQLGQGGVTHSSQKIGLQQSLDRG